jgi:hypothetical protein
MSDTIERLRTESDLCRNDGAKDIAELLDQAASDLAYQIELNCRLNANNALLRAELDDVDQKLAALLAEDKK